MPVRQIRKNIQKRSKQMRSNKTRKYTNKQINHRGGSTGMPPSYYGNGNSGYYAAGSPELSPACMMSKQNAVSRGVLSQSGSMAGPNLYPMMGGKAYQKQKHSKSHNKSKSRKYKTKQNKTKQYLTGSYIQ